MVTPPLRKMRAITLTAILWPMLALTLLLGAGAIRAQTPVAPAGAGTLADPFQVTELGNLVWMSNNVATQGVADKCYKMMNDIDASGTASWNDNGTTTALVGFPPIGGGPWPPFAASFDGQGHTISGLTIDRPAMAKVGLFGSIGTDGTVSSLRLDNLSVAGRTLVGGLAGDISITGQITNCSVSGVVTGTDAYVGGLAGRALFFGAITNCHADVKVAGGVGGTGLLSYFGGLVGHVGPGTVTDCSATGEVATGDEAAAGMYFGGLLGRNTGSPIVSCFATGDVNVKGDSGLYGYAGGLVGANTDAIMDCYATGRVVCKFYTGGLVGANSGTITRSFATGAAEAGQSQEVGGLAGINSGRITDCYATGAASGWAAVGGLVGQNYGPAVTNCYSVGAVAATGMFAGGLIGSKMPSGGAVTSSYWNTETSGQSGSAGGTGETTIQLQQQATFAGWDFVNVWGIGENTTYPFLRRIQQPPAAPLNVSPASNAAGVAVAPTLAASVFTDANTTDTHAASQWQVRADASSTSWTVTVFDSGATSVALTSCAVPPGTLQGLTSYWWRVRYEDNHGNWSVWSSPTTFQTLLPPPSAPTGVVASDGRFIGRVRVTWDPSPGALAYRVYRSTGATTATATALTGWIAGTTTYDDLVATPGLTYYYWVRAATDATGSIASDFGIGDSGWASRRGMPVITVY